MLFHTGEMDPAPETFAARLAPGDWDALCLLGSRRRYPAGTTLYSAGDLPQEVMVVLDGQVKALIPSFDG